MPALGRTQQRAAQGCVVGTAARAPTADTARGGPAEKPIHAPVGAIGLPFPLGRRHHKPPASAASIRPHQRHERRPPWPLQREVAQRLVCERVGRAALGLTDGRGEGHFGPLIVTFPRPKAGGGPVRLRSRHIVWVSVADLQLSMPVAEVPQPQPSHRRTVGRAHMRRFRREGYRRPHARGVGTGRRRGSR